MSDHFIALIPADSTARLSPEALADLRNALAGICGTDECRAKDFGERLQFIDCGENFEAVFCQACGKEADVAWWGQRMDHAWDEDHGFHMCDFEMPCCGASARLDSLQYQSEQGFARWFVSARAPGRGELTDDAIARLEATAGIPLHVIYQTY